MLTFDHIRNILQFVDTTKKLITSTKQIATLGAREEHIDLASLTHELQGWLKRITPPDPRPGNELSAEEESLRALSDQCTTIARELLRVLASLTVKEQHGVLGHIDSFYKAMLGEWKQAEIKDLASRLDRIENSIGKQLSSYQLQRLDRMLSNMQGENARLGAQRSEDLKDLKKHFTNLFKGISEKMDSEGLREETTSDLLRAAKKGSQYSFEQTILDQLRFDAIDMRQESIQAAHGQTLSWLFGRGGHRSPATFEEWLVGNENIFWVSGKPGSGKSTLMKFLCSYHQTSEKLKIWAQGKEMIFATYFFWSAGNNKLQKSQVGLLRSLVYQILRQRPDMISQAYPQVWRLWFPEAGVSQSTHNLDRGELIPLQDVKSLHSTLQAILTQLVASGAKLCFFIDGLDEYDGKPSDMVELVKRMSRLNDLKLCVSSREWNEFETEFGRGGSKLYMQDFNSEDITAYVRDTLGNNPDYQELEDDKCIGEEIQEIIVQNARGVFLWVYLVVDSLQEGLTNGDSMARLKTRLNELPTELDDYFKQILLGHVDQRYHSESAEMFSVTLEGSEDLPVMAYWFMGEQEPDYVVKLEARPLSPQSLNKRFKTIKKRLSACCKGLLSIHFRTPQGDDASLPSSILFDRKVSFLHRTVRDYLLLDDTRKILRAWHSPSFNPHASICQAVLGLLKIAPDQSEYWGDNKPAARLTDLLRSHLREVADEPDNSTALKISESLEQLLRARHATIPSQQIDPISEMNSSTEQPEAGPSNEQLQPQVHTEPKTRGWKTSLRRLKGKVPGLRKI